MPAPESELSAYARIAWGSRVLLFVTGLSVGASLFALSFLMEPTYRAVVTLVPGSSGSTADALDALGVLGTSLENIGIRSTRTTTDPVLYRDISLSRKVLASILSSSFQRMDGKPTGPYAQLLAGGVSGEQQTQRALKALRNNLSVDLDRRSGLVTVTAKASDPKVAATIANNVVEGLQDYLLHSMSTQAGANRKFIEGRLSDTREALDQSEEALTSFRERNVRIGNSPRLELEESRLKRTVRDQEELYLLLERQFELARIDESRDTPVLNILDEAVPPIRREWPKRSMIGIFGFAMGAAIALSFRVYRTALHGSI